MHPVAIIPGPTLRRRSYSGHLTVPTSSSTSARTRDPDTLRAERALARRLADREPRALEELYATTSRACFSVVLGIVRDRGHAEDVQQQVYAELWRRSGQFDPDRGSLMTWVLTIARSRALDHLRRRSDQPMDADVLVARAGGEEDRAFDELIDRALVAEALTALPEQERSLLQMRFWEGLSQTEIAERHGIPLGTVKSRMTSGLQRLRTQLAHHEVAR